MRFLLERGAAGLFLDPGLGKTSITFGALSVLLKRKLMSKALVIAPLRVCHSVWPAERDKWLDFNGLRVVVLHGPKKDQLLNQEADIYVINPEGLEWLLKPIKTKGAKKTSIKVDARAFSRLGFDVLVVDELTKFKNSTSIRFRMMKQVLHTFARRWGLTGSPAANGLEGLFGQVYVLDQGHALGGYITHFRDEYFSLGYDGFTYSLLPGAEERIYRQLNPLVLRMAAADYLELPQLVENVIGVELPEAARAIYDALEGELVSEMDVGTVTAKNVGVALGKCRQVASGAIYAEAALGELVRKAKGVKRDWHLIHDAKLDALADLVDELQGSPLLVAYEFQHDLERLRERFGRDLPCIGAGVSAKRGQELEAAWNRGELPILAAHPVSIAHGLNLQQAGNHIAWFTLTWDYENYEQLIRRLLRQGAKAKRIFVHLLVATGTIDEQVLGALRGKGRGQNALFAGLKALQSAGGRRRENNREKLKKAIYK